MDSLPQTGARNYTPHLYQTRLHSCKRIRESHWEVRKVLSYYHVKRSSLYRWLKRYDELGEDGLKDRSHKPKTPHPSTICPKAAYKVKCFHDQAGKHNWSSVDIWAKTVSSGFPMSYSTALRYLKRLEGYKPYGTNPKRCTSQQKVDSKRMTSFIVVVHSFFVLCLLFRVWRLRAFPGAAGEFLQELLRG